MILGTTNCSCRFCTATFKAISCPNSPPSPPGPHPATPPLFPKFVRSDVQLLQFFEKGENFLHLRLQQFDFFVAQGNAGQRGDVSDVQVGRVF